MAMGTIQNPKMNAAPNNSLDVSRKQRLYYDVALLPQTCVVAVCGNVNSTVMLLLLSATAALFRVRK